MDRSTSAVKSTWPGVSIRLTVCARRSGPGAGGGGGVDRDAAALLLGVEVHDGGALVDLAHLVDLAGVARMRSETVVLPASMWAAMPMLRILDRSRDINSFRFRPCVVSPNDASSDGSTSVESNSVLVV